MAYVWERERDKHGLVLVPDVWCGSAGRHGAGSPARWHGGEAHDDAAARARAPWRVGLSSAPCGVPPGALVDGMSVSFVRQFVNGILPSLLRCGMMVGAVMH